MMLGFVHNAANPKGDNVEYDCRNCVKSILSGGPLRGETSRVLLF